MMQRRKSSPEGFGGGDVESFGDPSESGNWLPLSFGCTFLPRCKVLNDELENVCVVQRDVLHSGHYSFFGFTRRG